MSKARLLRDSIEALIGTAVQKARVLRQSTEVLVGSADQPSRLLRESVETLVGSHDQPVQLLRVSVELLILGDPPAILCGKIVEVAGAAWRGLMVTARVKVASSDGPIRINIVALMPGQLSPTYVFETLPIIAEGELEATPGVLKPSTRVLPVGTLVSRSILATGVGASGLTTELHYRTHAVSQ